MVACSHVTNRDLQPRRHDCFAPGVCSSFPLGSMWRALNLQPFRHCSACLAYVAVRTHLRANSSSGFQVPLGCVFNSPGWKCEKHHYVPLFQRQHTFIAQISLLGTTKSFCFLIAELKKLPADILGQAASSSWGSAGLNFGAWSFY